MMENKFRSFLSRFCKFGFSKRGKRELAKNLVIVRIEALAHSTSIPTKPDLCPAGLSVALLAHTNQSALQPSAFRVRVTTESEDTS